MKLSEICIKRPVLSWVMTLIIIMLGLVAFSRLQIQYYPNIDKPAVEIETEYQGAGADIIEAAITRPLEDRLGSIDGLDTIQSISSLEKSKVIVTGNDRKTLMDLKFDVIEAINDVKRDLPSDVQHPKIKQSGGGSKAFVLSLVLHSDKFDLGELAEFARNEIEKDLESVEGVAQVIVSGSGNYKMHIYLDPVKLAAHNMAVLDVANAIKRHNFELPAGHINSGDRQYVVTTVSNYEKAIQFEAMAVADHNGHVIRIKDLGRVEMTPEEKTTRSRFNGKQVINISINRQATANPLSIVDGVHKKMKSINSRLRTGMILEVGADYTSYIRQSINEVYKTIFEAIIFVGFVVLLFLRSWRASLIPLVTIPISLIGVFAVMYVLGFTINMMTLTAMVLAIGLVVDDAIVVLENIHRYIEKGLNPMEAAFKGVKEIAFAVIAMTLTLSAVYSPIALAEGMTGKYLLEFAITLASAVVISGFVALTLSPMMCARTLMSHKDENAERNKYAFYRWMDKYLPINHWMNIIEDFYKNTLHFVLQLKSKVLMGALLSVVIIFMPPYGLYHYVPTALFPKEDRGNLTIKGNAPATSTIEFTERYVKELDKFLATIPEIKKRDIRIENTTYFTLYLTLDEKRKRSTAKIIKDIEKKFSDIIGIDARIETDEASVNQTLQFTIRGNKDVQQLEQYSHLLYYELTRSNLFLPKSPLSSQLGQSEQYIITIDPKTDAIRTDPRTVAETIQSLIKGRKAGDFKKDNRPYDVMVEVEDKNRQTIEDIKRIYIKPVSNDSRYQGLKVPLSELIHIQPKMGYSNIVHYQRTRARDQLYVLRQGANLNEAVKRVSEATKNILPEDIYSEFTGETKNYLKEGKTALVVFILAICFIYLVLAAQFESWIDPFIIVLGSVPLSLVGGFLGVSMISGVVMSIYTMIGFVTLIGLITKHGIMMVEFANTLREEEMLTPEEAISKASRLRLRPILMTSLAMILGVVPMLFDSGPTSTSRIELGSVIVGGLFVGTFMTLYVIPCVYVHVISWRERLRTRIRD